MNNTEEGFIEVNFLPKIEGKIKEQDIFLAKYLLINEPELLSGFIDMFGLETKLSSNMLISNDHLYALMSSKSEAINGFNGYKQLTFNTVILEKALSFVNKYRNKELEIYYKEDKPLVVEVNNEYILIVAPLELEEGEKASSDLGKEICKNPICPCRKATYQLEDCHSEAERTTHYKCLLEDNDNYLGDCDDEKHKACYYPGGEE